MNGLIISGWSAVSALGMGARQHAAGLRSGASGVVAVEEEPVAMAATVPGYDTVEVLGTKGTRSMDRVTGLAVTAVGLLLEGKRERPADENLGLVLGTTVGSAQSTMDFTRDSLTRAKPFHVDPAVFPNTVMNFAAGQCAIWYGLTGPNTTLAGGRVTGLNALKYTARLRRSGYVDTILCGAVEEFTTRRAWLEWHAEGRPGEPTPLGEGCAVFRLETRQSAERNGRSELGEVLAVEFGVWGEHAPLEEVLLRCAKDVLARTGTSTRDVWAVSLSECPGYTEPEESVVSTLFDGKPPRTLRSRAALGETACVSAAFQLAGVLSTAQDAPADSGAVALIMSVDRDGLLGCALVRVQPRTEDA